MVEGKQYVSVIAGSTLVTFGLREWSAADADDTERGWPPPGSRDAHSRITEARKRRDPHVERQPLLLRRASADDVLLACVEMTGKQFFDWQTAGGTNDVMRLVDALERADIVWCAIGGVAVNHWAAEPIVTRDVDFVVAATDIERAVSSLEQGGFHAEHFEWSVNFTGGSAVSLQLSTEPFYREFPSRSVPADVHGILMRVASLHDTLAGKVKAWNEPGCRPSKRIKDLADIARLVESHPELWGELTNELKTHVPQP
jgi:nucleotidyltransferase AbiEii toxin of type IV toxin-antitoxin system